MLSFRKWCVLLAVYVVYMLAGAVIFVALEVNNEKSELYELFLLKQHVIEVVYGLDNSSRVEVEEVMREVGEECGHDFLSIDQDAPLTWSLWNSFFFSFTVITTIGFGHMAPKTSWGRVVCIGYAILGVPLNGILIAALAEIFSAKLVIRDVKRWAERYRSSLQVAVDATLYVLPGLIIFLVLPSVVIMVVEEGWSYLDCFYYAFITLTTIGFGDHVAGRQEMDLVWVWLYKIISVVWIIFGLGYIIMIITFIQKALKHKHVRKVERKVTKILKKHVGKLSLNISRDLRKVRKVVKGGRPRVYPENEESNKDELCQTPTIPMPDCPAHKDRGAPYRRHRSASESDILTVEKGLYSGWSLDQVLELVERLLCEEELRATENLQAHLIQQLRRGFLNKQDSRDTEGDVEVGEEESEESDDLHKHRTGRFSCLIECIGKSRIFESTHNENSECVKGKHQEETKVSHDEPTNVKETEGKRMSVGYLNHCYQDDQGNHSHAYHCAPSSESSRTCLHLPHRNHDCQRRSSDVHRHKCSHSDVHKLEPDHNDSKKHEHNPSDNKKQEHNLNDNHNRENNPSDNYNHDHNHENNPNDRHNCEPDHIDNNNHNTGRQSTSQTQDRSSQQSTSKSQEFTRF